MIKHRPLLTTNGMFAVGVPEIIQPKLPALTNSLIVIGSLANIPPALRNVAIQPAICESM